MLIEILFFIFGIIPYWYTIYLPHKTRTYWLTIAWCCIWFIAYFSYHGAHAAVVNNVVELGLSIAGLWRIHRWKLDGTLIPPQELE